MTLPPLENLLRSGLKKETPNDREIENLIRSGERRLNDATNTSLSLESRFDLAYNAAHALALAALRHHGYRSDNRYLVFQTLAHTVALPAEHWRVLDAAHRKRNAVECEGIANLDEQRRTRLSVSPARFGAVCRCCAPRREKYVYTLLDRGRGFDILIVDV
jgi:hypothetical protein